MSTEPIATATVREPKLRGQTVVVIGGSAGIGLETARLARAEGAEVILTGRNPERLERAARELGALSSAAFDSTDDDELERFFDDVPSPIDHLMLSGSGPYYAPLAELDFAEVHKDIDRHLLLPIRVTLQAAPKVRPGGSLLFIGGTGGRRRGVDLALIGAMTAALPALVANLALQFAPVRVILIAPGFVDTPFSASPLGDQLEARRQQLRDTLPIGRVVGPADVAALAVHLMSNTALTPRSPPTRTTCSKSSVRRSVRNGPSPPTRRASSRRIWTSGSTRTQRTTR